MAFWRAPWNTVFARPVKRTDDEFSLIDAADATSQYGVLSIHSEPCLPTDTVPAHGYPWDLTNDTLNAKYAASTWSGYSSVTPWDECLSRHDRFPYTDERSYSTLSRRDALALELAGRHNDGHLFRDSRSGGKNLRRRRADLQKYYGYRAVNRGQLNAEHMVTPQRHFEPAPLPTEMPVRTLNKRDLFTLAQDYPRPPKHHRRWVNKERWPLSARYEARRDARKHARHDFDLEDEIALVYDYDYAIENRRRDLADYLDELDLQRARYAELQAEAMSQKAGPAEHG